MPSIAEQAELIEAEAMYRVVASAPPDLKRKFNVTARRIGGGVVLAAAGAADPSGFWSKALGLGISAPVTAALIAEICAFFRSCGAELATVQIAPGAMPPDWAEIAARIERAIDSGASWISTEATAGDNGQSSSSLHNAERAGFQVSYVRDSWTWQAGP